ncbi:MAG: hypothetical protein HY900_34755 [Deltaproteobacteria bacterium]|nr:hypothetical protein [Deltaproteobacteria bacterium]
MTKDRDADVEELMGGVLRLNAQVLGFALGVLFGLAIFLATNWLVVKGGKQVGPHLQLLSQYFLGYRVTFLGSFVGAAYGFAVGTLAGAAIGWVYNAIIGLRYRGAQRKR